MFDFFIQRQVEMKKEKEVEIDYLDRPLPSFHYDEDFIGFTRVVECARQYAEEQHNPNLSPSAPRSVRPEQLLVDMAEDIEFNEYLLSTPKFLFTPPNLTLN